MPSRPDRCLQDSPPKTNKYKFFSAPHGIYTTIDYTMESKTLLRKRKRTEIITLSQTTVQSNWNPRLKSSLKTTQRGN